MATPFDLPWKWLQSHAPRRNEIRFNAKYRCKHCNESWKVKNTNKLRMPCKNQKNCRGLLAVRAYKFEPIDVLVVYSCPDCGNKIKQKRCESEIREEVPLCKICGMIDMEVYDIKYLWRKVRKFGEFHCDNCFPNRTWKSGQSWEGYGQKCIRCNYMILPHNLTPLRPPEFINRGEERPPHQEHLCEMCKKLGRNCQTYVPPDQIEIAELDEIPLEEDLQSVITTNSSIPGDGNDDDGSDGTPVNSEDGGRPNDLDSIEELDQMIRDLKLNKRDDDSD